MGCPWQMLLTGMETSPLDNYWQNGAPPGSNPEFLYVIPDTFEIDPEKDSGVRDNVYFDVYI